MKTNVVSRVVAVIGLVLLIVSVASAGNGPGGAPGPMTASPGNLLCRVTTGPVLGVQVTVQDTYMGEEVTRVIRLGGGRLLCTSTTVSAVPPAVYTEVTDPAQNALRCYSVSNVSGPAGQNATSDSDPQVIDDDGFSTNEATTVGGIQFLCTPTIVINP